MERERERLREREKERVLFLYTEICYVDAKYYFVIYSVLFRIFFKSINFISQ